jgi:hypothetical protein
MLRDTQARKMVAGMGAQDHFIRNLAGLVPGKAQVRLRFEPLDGGGDALRPFRVTRGMVSRTAVVGDDLHGRIQARSGWKAHEFSRAIELRVPVAARPYFASPAGQ